MGKSAQIKVANNKLLTNIKEEQTSSDESQVKTKAKSRRASIACISCRDRRIRCVVPAGKRACLQCQRGNAICTIKDDDERRRPISRAYVHSLVERIALLEGLLKDQDLPFPPADHPPESRHHSHHSRGETSSSSSSQSPASNLKGSPSSSETSSAPRSSILKTLDDYCTSKKRPLVPYNINDGYGRASKKSRKDSLVLPTCVKVESPINDHSDSTVLSDELHASAQMSPSIPTFFWPKTDGYTSGGTTLYPRTQNNEHYTVYSTWSGSVYGLQDSTDHPTDAEYREAMQLDSGHETFNAMKCGPTNIDFMPFGRDEWSS